MAGEPARGIRGLGCCVLGPAAGVRRISPTWAKSVLGEKGVGRKEYVLGESLGNPIIILVLITNKSLYDELCLLYKVESKLIDEFGLLGHGL